MWVTPAHYYLESSGRVPYMETHPNQTLHILSHTIGQHVPCFFFLSKFERWKKKSQKFHPTFKIDFKCMVSEQALRRKFSQRRRIKPTVSSSLSNFTNNSIVPFILDHLPLYITIAFGPLRDKGKPIDIEWYEPFCWNLPLL